MTTFIKSKAVKAVVGLLALVAVIGGVSVAHAYTFTQYNTLGSDNAEVMVLQQTLNANGFTVSTSGAGSIGMESTYFGAKTKAAVVAFQAAKGISPLTGGTGPLTRAALNALGGSSVGLPAGCSTNTGFSSTTGANCATGTMSNLPAGCMAGMLFSPVNGQACVPGQTTVTSGGISVSIATDNPSGGTVVSGQARADLAHFTFMGTGTVQNITLQRTGVSANSTLQNVYLYQGAVRLTDAASVNSYGVIAFNNVNLAVNGSATVSVQADIDPGTSSNNYNAGQTLGVSLTGYTVAGGTAAATASLQGNLMQVSSGNGILAKVVVAQSLSANPDSGSATYNNVIGSPSVDAGTTSYTVWSAPVQVSTRSVWLKGLTLRYIGSAANGSLTNVKLYVNGVQAGGTALVNQNGYIVFDLSGAPVVLNTGSSTVEVRADISSGSARTFYVSLQNASDLQVTDSQLNVNVATTTGTSTAFAISQGATISVNAGSATFQVDPAFQTMTNVTGGSANAIIGQFKLHGYGEDVKVMSLPITIGLYGAVPTAAGLNNVALYFNGAQVGSSVNLTGAGASCAIPQASSTCYSATFQLGSSLIIPAGSDNTLQIRADLQNASFVNYTGGQIAVQVGAGASNGQGMTSLTSVNVPGGASSGNSLTIQTGQLIVAKNAAYTNQTYSPNTTGVKLASFTLQNQSSSEAVRVTALQVGLTSDGTTALTSSSTPPLTNFTNLKTSETSGSGSTPIGNVNATNTFSVDFTIPAGGSKTIDIMGDLSSFASNQVIVTLLPTAIGQSSNVTLTPTIATQGQTISLGSGTVSAPSFVSSSSTTSQYIATAMNAANASQATYKFTATNGSGTISELRFAVLGSTAGVVSSINVGTSTASVVTPANSALTAPSTLTVGSESLSVTAGTANNFPAGTILTIGTEQLLVTSVTDANTLVATHAVNGTVGATHIATSTVAGSGLATLTNVATTVPNGTAGAYVVAYQTYSPVNGIVGALPSGSTATVYLTYVKSTIGSATSAAAVLPVAANPMTLVGSVPSLTVNGSQQTGLVIGAENKIGEVAVSANIAGPISLHSVKFNIGNSGFASGFALTGARLADGSTTISSATCTVNGGNTAITCAFSPDYLIQGQSSKTFSLYANVAGVTASSSIVSVSSAVDQTGFQWVDTAGGSTVYGTPTSLTGTLIYGFPTNSYSIRQ